MKKIIIIFVLTLSSINLFADNSIFSKLSLKNQFIFPEVNIPIEECIYRAYNDKYYLMRVPVRKLKKNDFVNLWEISEKSTRRLKLWISEDSWVISIAINSNYIAVLTQGNIVIYGSKKGAYIKTIKIDRSCNIIKLNKNKVILLGSCYTCEVPGTYASIYNIDTESLIKEFDFSNIHGHQMLSFCPRNNIDYNNGVFIVSDITRYNITFYNENFQIINQINYLNPNWGNNAELETELNKFNSKEFNKVISSDKPDKWLNKYSIINKIDLISKDKLIVSYQLFDKKLNKSNIKFDIWVKINNKWQLKENELCSSNKTSEIMKIMEFNSLFNLYSIDNNKLIIPSIIPFDVAPYLKKEATYKEFWDKIENYYKTNQMSGSIFIYNFTE
jgi:hypothetical protein